MTSEHDTVHLRLENREAWIQLDRPPLNVLNIPMMRALDSALERVLPNCNFMVFQGAGDKAFSAGAEVADHVPERVGEMLTAFHGVFRKLSRAKCVTIAAVHGHCLGGGMELATFCDFVIAGESAKFGQPEIKLGCFPPIAMITLPQLIGLRAAMDLILTGRIISASEAHRLGLVTRIVSDSELGVALEKLLAELRAMSPATLKLSRQTIWQLHGDDFARKLDEVERIYLSELMKIEDAREGIQAFLEKRKPSWQEH